MSCGFPVKCLYWQNGKCIFDFENWDGKSMHPCERHSISEINDARQEMIQHYQNAHHLDRCGDLREAQNEYGLAEMIRKQFRW